MSRPKLIVGLGNPGFQYRGTRHNMGFWVVEHLGRSWNISTRRRAYSGRYGQGTVDGADVGLFLPQTFMNLSGLAVRQAVSQLHLSAQDLLVVSDDLDLAPGKLRLRLKGSSGGHNGLGSIIEALGTEDFARLRVGIGRPEGHLVVEWVLGYFSREEHQVMADVVSRAAEVLKTAVTQGFEAAMMAANG